MIHPYEDRYRRVYAAGARSWETPLPTEELVDFVGEAGFQRGSKVIEFGCGEGRDAILAKSGFEVTAVDIAPTAVERARERAIEEETQVNFQVNARAPRLRLPRAQTTSLSMRCLSSHHRTGITIIRR